jgi:hypothetical protein
MIKVSGLPVNITKSDLDELFLPYGTIQITENSVLINIKETESIAHLELDKNQELAIQKLDRRKWRDNILYLDSIRGDELEFSQPGGGGATTQKLRSKRENGGDAGPRKPGQPGGGKAPTN